MYEYNGLYSLKHYSMQTSELNLFYISLDYDNALLNIIRNFKIHLSFL